MKGLDSSVQRTIGILSDTHSILDDNVAEVVRQCDMILHAGDIGGAGVLRELSAHCGQVRAVLGNNDVQGKWAAEDHAVLTGLEEVIYLDVPGGRIAMEHGHRIWDTRHYHQRLRKRHPDARLIVYGHTHVQTVDTRQRPWVVNPGAAGRERTKQGPSCLVLKIVPREESQVDWSIRAYRFEKKSRRSRA